MARTASPGRGPRQLEYLGRAFDDERSGARDEDLRLDLRKTHMNFPHLWMVPSGND